MHPATTLIVNGKTLNSWFSGTLCRALGNGSQSPLGTTMSGQEQLNDFNNKVRSNFGCHLIILLH